MIPVELIYGLEAGALALGVFELSVAYVARARRFRGVHAPQPAPAAQAWKPPAAIIVPTKGARADLAVNLGALLKQDYPAYDVYFAVETADDPGVPAIDALVAQARVEGWPGRGHLVVAGLTTTCSQQNANMLAGVQAAGPAPSVLAFCDNDIAPQPGWLSALVAPLATQAVAVTSGYRWVCGRSGTVAEHAHMAIALSMYVHFSFVSKVGHKGLWGGSFALRRTDFESWGVGARWRETILDDMSLMGIIQARGLRSVLVDDVLTVTDDTFDSSAAACRWYARQLLNVKAHERLTWLLVGAGHLAAAVAWLGVVAALVALLAGCGLTGLRGWGGGAALLLALADFAATAFASGIAPTKRRFVFLLRLPWARGLQAWAFLATLGRNVIWWSGVGYQFDRTGRVVRVDRSVT
jgi:hypothetical protein